MKLKLFVFFLIQVVGLVTSGQQKVRLLNGWEFLRQDLGGIWEAVRPVGKGAPKSVPLWQQMNLPYCVNAEDAFDPDLNYYQGPARYRTFLEITNPYVDGRTLLHFEGAAQKIEIYIHTTRVGSHTGGYDEFTIDITDAVEAFRRSEILKKQFSGKIPIIIRTDNSRDLEMIPSDLSSLNLYGGIYRYLNLVYVPVFSIEKIFAAGETDKAGKAGKVIVKSRFYNPSQQQKSADIVIRLFDPKGKLVNQEAKTVTASGDVTLGQMNIAKPHLWSHESPQLYSVAITVKSGKDSVVYKEKIGFRHFEFVEKGPFLLNGKRVPLKGTHRHEDHVVSASSEKLPSAFINL